MTKEHIVPIKTIGSMHGANGANNVKGSVRINKQTHIKGVIDIHTHPMTSLHTNIAEVNVPIQIAEIKLKIQHIITDIIRDAIHSEVITIPATKIQQHIRDAIQNKVVDIPATNKQHIQNVAKQHKLDKIIASA